MVFLTIKDAAHFEEQPFPFCLACRFSHLWQASQYGSNDPCLLETPWVYVTFLKQQWFNLVSVRIRNHQQI